MSDGLSAPEAGLLRFWSAWKMCYISLGRGADISVGLWVNEDGRMLSPYLPTARKVGPAGNFTANKEESFSRDGVRGQSEPDGE